MEITFERARPKLVELFIQFMLIGIQSFGGGSSTFILIHQTAIQRRWLTEEEFVRAWAIVQIAPGINLVKLTVMIGYRLQGWLGIGVAVSGLLLPSAAVTVLMTAGFATLRNLSWLQAMMKGVLPATIGLSLAMGVQMAQPIFTRAYREGRVRLGAHLFILSTAALLLAVLHVSPVVILLLSGIMAIALFFLIPTSQPQQSTEKKSK